MTTRIVWMLALAGLLILGIGCSDDDNPTGGGGDLEFTDTTVYDAAADVYRTTLDASEHGEKAYFSFADALAGIPKPLAGTWDITFSRTNINLNGGFSAEAGGTVVGASLGDVNFDSVSIEDTVGVEWQSDELAPAINEWYSYNYVTHQLDMTHYVYTMLDAEGDNFVKLRVDSIVGAGQPPSMGTVYITYYYQPTANSSDLSGNVQSAAIVVGSGMGYFDFSSGQQVNPTTPSTSTGWDIAIGNYEVLQNGGPNGPGECAAFPMYTELTSDPTDIDAATAQPAMAPLFADFVKSVFVGDLIDESQNWYSYDGTTHTITSRAEVYLIKAETSVFKLEIESYYGNIGGVPTSGHFTFKWREL
jgi:hypothetical protein